MTTTTSTDPARTTRALLRSALHALLLMMALMMGALWAGVEPHPPAAKAPTIAAIAALCWLAQVLVRADHPRAWIGVLLAALACLPAFGPHKLWIEPQALALAPVIVVGSCLLVTLVLGALRLRGARQAERAR
ncbi:MAG: hypothetical protein R3E48_05155 [Burkholderiaceae bacterium]